MDYERIQKPQGGGGFSPAKLRTMLLGVEKKRKQDEEQVESSIDLRSQLSHLDDDSGKSGSDSCKDVDVVSVIPECSTSTTADSMAAVQNGGHRRSKDHSLGTTRNRFIEDQPGLDYDSGHDNMSVSSSIFEFQKTERALQRVPLGPFSKPAPSKWDDAQKWIASPTANQPKTGQGGQGVGSRKGGNFGHGKQSSTKVVLEVPDQRMVPFEEPDTKRIDTNHAKKDDGLQKFVNWESDPYPVVDSYGKPVLLIENSVADSATRSVSMRDMGTEMTPIVSQEPSRTGTPVRSTTPIRSPNSSMPSTPNRAVPSVSPENSDKDHLGLKMELSEKELQMKTRREIMVLGAQLGKTNIAAWASKEEDKDASTSLKTVAREQASKSVIETRAAAWEEAEKAKYMARFKREEMKIQAWEIHQKAKTEAEMKKIEVDVERMRGRAHDKLMNKLAAARHKAEEKRAAAEAKRNQQAAETEQQADYVRRTGRIPYFCCWSWCP
ncbi:uncharacterized protein LOC120145498 isoform X2 [Hibiscus syriacus]|uniref:uncharacterized protein LOC120145498 isoform X2 n=1 Tax=Hibiscus syriacus TaxID=106335 RepID=UPI001920770A|nr:uncharacterized protein LOC120145498 isoform X2 [Hibiscus syriacus]